MIIQFYQFFSFLIQYSLVCIWVGFIRWDSLANESAPTVPLSVDAFRAHQPIKSLRSFFPNPDEQKIKSTLAKPANQVESSSNRIQLKKKLGLPDCRFKVESWLQF